LKREGGQVWWKLGVLAFATVVVLALLLVPIGTMTVKIDLPPVAGSAAAERTLNKVTDGDKTMALALGASLVTLILGGATLIGWRIVRHHRGTH
jgi:hypothetical protein